MNSTSGVSSAQETGEVPAVAGTHSSQSNISHEDTDGHGLWNPKTKYDQVYRRQQRGEAWYILALLVLSLLFLIFSVLGGGEWICNLVQSDFPEKRYVRNALIFAAAGLLGGTIYGAKWLYHAVARGLWHEDRKLWRYLSPWISLGTTVGVGALIDAGFFKGIQSGENSVSISTLVGIGFLLGYFSDKALVKMKEMAEVLFGESKSRFEDRDDPLRSTKK